MTNQAWRLTSLDPGPLTPSLPQRAPWEVRPEAHAGVMTVERSRASKSVAESLDRVLDGGIIILDRDTLLSVLGIRLLVLEDIPPAPRGIPQVEVTFSIDADGIVKARARDMATGKERGMKMAADGGLPKEEFEPLKAEGEEFAPLG